MTKLKDLEIGTLFTRIDSKDASVYMKTDKLTGHQPANISYREIAYECVVIYGKGRDHNGETLRILEEENVYHVIFIDRNANEVLAEAYYRDLADGHWTSDLLTMFTESFANLFKAILDEKTDGTTIARNVVDMEDVLNIIRRKHTSQDAYDKACERVLKAIKEWEEERND